MRAGQINSAQPHLHLLVGDSCLSHMAMVKCYARIAQTDCAKAHQKASPVDNWRL